MAAGDVHPGLREQAVQALTAGKEPTQQVITALMQLSTSGAHSGVRARAVQALAAGKELTEPVINTLVQLATSDTDNIVRMRALEALTAADDLTESANTALVQLATSDAHQGVRTRAIGALAAGRALTGPLLTAALRLAAESASPTIRRQMVMNLRHTPPEKWLTKLLVDLFLDSDSDVRRAAGNTLVEMSRRYPKSAGDIQLALSRACTNPAFSKMDGGGFRAAWDYAYEALQRQLAVSAQQSIRALASTNAERDEAGAYSLADEDVTVAMSEPLPT